MRKKLRMIIVIGFGCLLFGGGLTVTVADSSVSGVLSAWLSKQTDSAIEEIDEVIQEEQQMQTERLKTVLADQISEKEQEWRQFVETEKEKRVTNLQVFTEEKILEITESGSPEAEMAADELERIFRQAISDMEKVIYQESLETEKEGGE